MGDNIILIGMAGAGKSTIGVQLAKLRGMDFSDTDLLIQSAHEQTLQTILDEQGYQVLRQYEEDILSGLELKNTVIATGGSAVYSEKAMTHLSTLGLIVYLEVSFDEIVRRVKNVDTRGIACPPELTFEDIFNERKPLYERYADLAIDNNGQSLSIEMLNEKIEEQRVKKA